MRQPAFNDPTALRLIKSLVSTSDPLHAAFTYIKDDKNCSSSLEDIWRICGVLSQGLVICCYGEFLNGMSLISSETIPYHSINSIVLRTTLEFLDKSEQELADFDPDHPEHDHVIVRLESQTTASEVSFCFHSLESTTKAYLAIQHAMLTSVEHQKPIPLPDTPWQWEYKVDQFYTSTDKMDRLESDLARLGRQGWELAGVASTPPMEVMKLFFKRRKGDLRETVRASEPAADVPARNTAKQEAARWAVASSPGAARSGVVRCPQCGKEQVSTRPHCEYCGGYLRR